MAESLMIAYFDYFESWLYSALSLNEPFHISLSSDAHFRRALALMLHFAALNFIRLITPYFIISVTRIEH